MILSALRAVKPRHLLMLLLVVQIILGALYSFATPLWQGHEADYYTVVRFLDHNGRLPSPDDYPAGDAEIRQATQPPLYFLVAYPIVALLDNTEPVPPGIQPNMICIGDGGANVPVVSYPLTESYLPPLSGAVAAGYGLRLLNVLLSVVAAVLTYRVGRVLFPAHPAIALLAVSMLAFEANMLQIYTEISNDTLLIALSAANLLIAAHLARRFTWKMMALLLVTVALVLITRLQGWAILAFDIPFIFCVGLLQFRAPLRARARTVLIAVGVLVLAGTAVALFNLLTYGNVLGRYSGLQAMITSAFQSFNLPWVTVVGVASFTYSVYILPLQTLEPRAALLGAYGLLIVLCFVGVFWTFVRAARAHRRDDLLALLVLSGMALTAVLLVIFRNALASNPANTTLYNTGVLFAPIRYYGPGLPAFALLLSAGLKSLVPSRFPLARFNLPGVLAAGSWLLVSVLGGVMLWVSRPASPVITPADFIAMPELASVEQASAPNTPQLLGYRMTPHPDDGVVDLTLYLMTDSPLTLNEFAQVDMVTPQGQRLNRCQFLPANGAYPTTLWKPGEIIAAQAIIPNCASPMSVPVELTLRWLGATADGAIVSQSDPPLPLASLDTRLKVAASCPENFGVIADSYEIVKFNSPDTVRAGEVYLPSVNWITLESSPLAVARTFTFTHQQTGTQYICTGTPSPQAYNVRIWQRGEQIYFDGCSMTFPADAPDGEYRVAVGITDANAQFLPATNAQGEPLPDNQVVVGEVSVIH